MNFKDCQFSPKNRRGLSSVVGALFFVILMVSAFSMLGGVLQNQGDMGQTAKIVANADLKKQQEDFKINIYANPPNQLLSVDVENVGQNHVEIPTLIITNSTDAANGFPTKVYDIPSDTWFVAPDYTQNIVSTTPITLKLAQNSEDIEVYHFKVISSIGTIKTTTVSCDNTRCGQVGTGGSLEATLFLNGPNGINNKTSTVVMFVSNTADVTLTDVQPTEGFTAPMCDDLWTFDNSSATENLFAEDVVSCDAFPSSSITLDPHTSTMFKWDATISGDVGSVFTFCGAVSGTHPDDGPITSGDPSCDSLTVIDPNDCGGCGTTGTDFIIRDDLYGRPYLYLMFPNPMGDSLNDEGIWGVMVANPTDADIYVSKVIIVPNSPRATSSDKIFLEICEDKDTPEKPVTISPTTDKWTCPDSNQLQWKDTSNPQLIKARSVFPFLVKIGAGTLGGTGDATNIPIEAVVFTTLGQYGKAGYATTVWHDFAAVPNVYLSRNPGSTIDSDIMGELRNIAMGSTITLNATIADMTVNTNYKINAGTKLIINIPADWTLDSIVSNVGFDDPVDTQTFPDGSSQITGTLTNDIDGNNDAKTIVFKVTAPVFEEARLYVMHILADGTSTGKSTPSDLTAGPISETVLQICPAAGCP